MSGFYDLSKQKLSSIFNYDLNNFYLSKIQEINAIWTTTSRKYFVNIKLYSRF